MGKFKKVLALALSVYLVVFGITTVSAESNYSAMPQYVSSKAFDYFEASELDNYNDVKDYLIEHGYEDGLDLNGHNFNENYNYQYSVNEDENNIFNKDKISVAEIEKLVSKYNLEKPQDEVIVSDLYYLVERDNTNQNIISNVWYLNYVTSNDGFTVKVLNVGTDPLDSVSGIIEKYDLNRDTWEYKDKKASFTQYQQKSGTVFEWKIAREAVSETFRYRITVSEDGQSWKYENKNENDHQRYYFLAGIYTRMSALGGERHHFVSSSALNSVSGFDSNYAPAIRMIYRDHLNTPNWGSSTSAKNFRNEEIRLLKEGKYEELLRMEVEGLKNASDSEGKYRNLQLKYYDQILEVLYLSEQYFGIR